MHIKNLVTGCDIGEPGIVSKVFLGMVLEYK